MDDDYHVHYYTITNNMSKETARNDARERERERESGWRMVRETGNESNGETLDSDSVSHSVPVYLAFF